MELQTGERQENARSINCTITNEASSSYTSVLHCGNKFKSGKPRLASDVLPSTCSPVLSCNFLPGHRPPAHRHRGRRGSPGQCFCSAGGGSCLEVGHPAAAASCTCALLHTQTQLAACPQHPSHPHLSQTNKLCSRNKFCRRCREIESLNAAAAAAAVGQK